MKSDLSINKNAKNWTQREIVETIQKIEKANNLLDGTSYHSIIWERIRTWLMRQINIKLDLYDISHDKENETSFGEYKRLLKYSIIANPFFILKKPKYIFFSHQRRKLTSDGLYEDLYTDKLSLLIDNNSCLSIEKDHQKKHLRPVVTKKIRYLDFIEFIILIKKRFYRKKSKIDKKFFKKIQEQICTEFGIEIDLLKRAKKIEKRYNLSVPLYRAMFRFLKPEIVFFVCSYGKENQIEAAKSLGIKTIEIQHGVLNSIHLGYSFPLPLRKSSFPDYFLSFGEYWSKYVDLPVSKENIIPLGYPYLTTNVKNYDISVKQNKTVFISQGTIGKQLSKIASNYVKNKKTTEEVIYKLHPGEYLRWKKEYKELLEASSAGLIHVVDSNNPPLYSILAVSKYVVGVYSTALFEALAFACQLVIIKLPGYEHMSDLIKSGFVQVVEQDEDIVLNQSNNSFNNIDFFFNQDYENSFKNAVKVISGSKL